MCVDVRKREYKIVQQLIASKNVILCTTVGAGNKLLKDTEFDLVIVDECAQGLEASTWIPILRGVKCVLAGDHLQLPPTIKSKEAEVKGLGLTLFERLIMNKKQFSAVTFLLDTQYRMNHRICTWASNEVYDSLLLSDDSVRHRSLQDFNLTPTTTTTTAAGTGEDDVTERGERARIPVMMLVDTAGCGMGEDQAGGGKSDTSTSSSNAAEARLVYRHARMLIHAGVSPSQIGIITPYNAQVQQLKKMFFTCHNSEGSGSDESDDEGEEEGVYYDMDDTAPASPELFKGIEIKSVDGFQGQ